MNTEGVRDMVTDALRYWEWRRIGYNALLTGVVLLEFAVHWPASREALNVGSVLGLFVLAVLANVAYCAAYVADLMLQLSHFRDQRRFWRAVVATVGFLFAAVLTYFFASGMFIFRVD